MQIELPDTLRRASQTDWKQVGDITAEAFAEDPINLWIFGNPKALRPLFRIFARDVYLKHGFSHIAGDGGATMWAMSDANTDLPTLALWKLIFAQMRYGASGAMKRAMQAGETMAKHHPSEPHLYLFTIGTRKAARGTGLGKALLSPVLSAADRDGKAVYLENSNPANHGFYRSHGFETREIFPIAEGGPPMEAMWRAPKT